jgi:hypothetical protein
MGDHDGLELVITIAWNAQPRVQDAWEWQVSISNRLHSGPR